MCTFIPRGLFAFTLLLMAALPNPVTARTGQLRLRVVDQTTGEAIPVRMHLKNKRGRAIVPKGMVSWKDHFVVPGIVTFELSPGNYTFVMERGPEYRVRYGSFELKSGATDSKQVDMVRIAELKKEGWWSGELHIHRPLKDIELLMRAEDLHVGPVITWWNERNLWQGQDLPKQVVRNFDGDRYYQTMGGEDERGGGALMYFNLKQPLAISGSQREYPSSVVYLMQAAAEEDAHIDIEKPFWWDMPIWLATGKVDSIGIAHNHMWRDGTLSDEAWGKPRPKSGYPAPQGNGRWTQHIYYQVLEAGLRIPPSAGSASGVLPNPVGYNRVYAHVDGDFTYDKWWQSLKAGRVFVTNGPLLRASIEGKLPGHVFSSNKSLSLQIALNLATREKIEYLEIIKNGRVEHEIRLSDVARNNGKLPEVEFQESGWVIVRAVTNESKTFRFASTGPFYVEIGQQPRISRKAVRFFQEWVDERAKMIKLDNEQHQAEVMHHIERAMDFWDRRQRNATAE